MKNHLLKRTAILFCTIICILPITFAFAAEVNDPALFRFNGKDVLRSEVVRLASAYGQAKMISSSQAFDEAIAYMIVNQLVPEAKARELGLDQYTEAEIADINTEAAYYFELQLDAYADALGANMSAAERAAFREQLRASWRADGTTVEAAQAAHRFNKTKERLLETMTVEISEEEIQQVFEQQAQKDENYFAGNILAYEYYTEYLENDIWYVPEGYRSVLRILLPADSALTEAYNAAVKAGKGEAEAAQALVDSKQTQLDAILARLKAGEAFADILRDVCADSLPKERYMTDGYAVHRESTVWGEAFVKAAFSAEMAQPGDVSAPAACKDGVFLLYYLRDIPAGRVEMNERIRDSITAYLTNQKRVKMLEDWQSEYEIIYYQDALDALMAAANGSAK